MRRIKKMKNNRQKGLAAYMAPSAEIAGLSLGSAILTGSDNEGGNETYSGYDYDWTDDLS